MYVRTKLQSSQNAFFWYITQTCVNNISDVNKQNGRQVAGSMNGFIKISNVQIEFVKVVIEINQLNLGI